MSTIAAVLWHDRHADPEITLFNDPVVAVAWVRKKHGEYDAAYAVGPLEHVCEGDTLNTHQLRDGTVFYATYGESNYIRVQMRTLDKEAT